MASKVPNFDSRTVEQIYETFGEPQKTEISRYDGHPLGPEVPPYVVRPAYFWKVGAANLTKQIKLIDFGEASFAQNERKKLHTPLPFRAPESFFGESIGPPADMWAFGCTVFHIFGEDHLFDGFMPSTDTILVAMVGSLGTLPPRWWDRWESRVYYFSSDGKTKTDIYTDDFEGWKPLARRIQELRPSGGGQASGIPKPFKPKELVDLQSLLAATLKYLPSERATAEDISNLDWIREHHLISGANSADISPIDPAPSNSTHQPTT